MILILAIVMQKKTIWDLHRVSAQEFREQKKMPLVIVLDNIRSLNNIGSIFRTADAFAAEKICLCGITATPPSDEIHKTALGAEQTVAWEYYPNTLDAIKSLKSAGFEICCLEQVKESVELQNFKVEQGKKYAIIAGHEVNGVAPEVVDCSDVCIEIPQRGTKHSMNVSVSVGVALWHFFSKNL